MGRHGGKASGSRGSGRGRQSAGQGGTGAGRSNGRQQNGKGVSGNRGSASVSVPASRSGSSGSRPGQQRTRAGSNARRPDQQRTRTASDARRPDPSVNRNKPAAVGSSATAIVSRTAATPKGRSARRRHSLMMLRRRRFLTVVAMLLFVVGIGYAVATALNGGPNGTDRATAAGMQAGSNSAAAASVAAAANEETGTAGAGTGASAGAGDGSGTASAAGAGDGSDTANAAGTNASETDASGTVAAGSPSGATSGDSVQTTALQGAVDERTGSAEASAGQTGSTEAGSAAAGALDKTASGKTADPALAAAASPTASPKPLPDGFVHLEDVIPDIRVDLRYFGTNNFMGKPAEGYLSNTAIMTEAAAKALKRVQKTLAKQDKAIVIYDAYRPASAVQDFVEWAEDAEDVATKSTYYPNLDKTAILEQGYIARKSAHSRGSTVDVSVVDLTTGLELDMGVPFDYFGEEAAPGWKGLTETQAANRSLLRQAMEKEGFRISSIEWWHFTLSDEPFPKTTYNFPVQ